MTEIGTNKNLQQYHDSNKDCPLVSIFLPIYRPIIVKKGFRASHNTKLRNIEIIVSDDCSPE